MKQENSSLAQLLDELENQKKHIAKLQADVGRWKRLAKGQGPRFEFIREQHDDRGRHIIEFYLKDIPGDLSYQDVLDYLKYEVLPHHYPYYYLACYQSKKYKGWIVKLAKDHAVDMSYLPENIGRSTKEVLRQLQWDIMMQLGRFEKYVAAAHLDNEIKEGVDLEKILQETYCNVQKINI